MEIDFVLCDTEDMTDETLGGFIRRHRKRGGWTQIELAREIRMVDRSVSEWELNRTVPSRDALARLAAVFGISLDEFRRFLDADAPKTDVVLPPDQKEKRQQAIKLVDELLADPKKLDQWLDYGEWLRGRSESQ